MLLRPNTQLQDALYAGRLVMCTVLGALTGATNYWPDVFSVDATTDIDGNAATTVAATTLPVLVMPKLFARCSLSALGGWDKGERLPPAFSCDRTTRLPSAADDRREH